MNISAPTGLTLDDSYVALDPARSSTILVDGSKVKSPPKADTLRLQRRKYGDWHAAFTANGMVASAVAATRVEAVRQAAASAPAGDAAFAADMAAAEALAADMANSTSDSATSL